MKEAALFVLLMTVISVSAETYTGTARWTAGLGYTDYRFSDLEQLGVERDAEKRAIRECYKSGGVVCLSNSVSIDRCNAYTPGQIPLELECVATATAIDIMAR